MRQLAFADLWGRKWVRRAAWTMAGVAVLWGVAWLAVPPLLKWQGEKLATAQLGREVRIGAVDFRPWSMTLTVSDLAVASADGQAAQLTVRRLSVDAELESLLRLAPVVDAVSVESPVMRLTHHGEGRYDIDDVLERLSRAPAQPSAGPARFALYNLSVTDGAVDFTDVPVQRTHALRSLQLSLPFLSNLPSKREVRVVPRLSFELNGSRFDSSAQATPFAPSHRTDAALRVQALDLAPYLGYLPARLPVRLQAAVLDADLWLAFEQAPATAVRLSGSLHARGVKLADGRGRELLALDALALRLDDVRPLARVVRLGDVTLTAPHLTVRRDLDLAGSPAPAAPASASQPRAATPGAGGADMPWQLAVARAAIRRGTVDWVDDSTTPPARLRLQDMTLDLADLAMPFAKPMRLKAGAQLGATPAARPPDGPTPAAADRATLTLEGTVSDQAGQLSAAVQALPLALAAPYRAQFLTPRLDGRLSAELALRWQAGADGAPDWQLAVNRLTLASLALGDGRTPVLAAQAVELTAAQLNPATRQLTLDRLLISQPSVQLARDTEGRWMFAQWLAQPAPTPGRPARARAPEPSAPAPWQLSVGELQLVDGRLAWRDQLPRQPVALDVSALQLRWTDFAPDRAVPSALQASARVAAGRGEPGRLAYRGQVRLAPALADGRLEATRLPLDALVPYLGDALNIEVLRAQTSFQGKVRYADSAAGPRVQVAGDALVEDFRAHSLAEGLPGADPPSVGGAAAPLAGPNGSRRRGGGEELLSWQALNLRGVDLQLAPGTPPRMTVRESALSDFFARVIIHENGRINLQDLMKAAPAAQAAPAPGAAAPAASSADVAAAGRTGVPSSQLPVASGPADPAMAPVIEFGPVSLLHGRIAFSDRFIRPNYSASLTELSGRLSAFSSQAPQGVPQMAELALRGRAEGTASLEITGQLNPLARPLALDIQGKVRDLELPPLSPYSVRYAGHGIERGKLSMDVRYTVQPDGQLTASNQLVLNQLSFGDKVDGAPASLPVKLAVALLADRNGVIDINLPIRGSINDPQFRLGAVIFRLLANLIAKAITAPFALLAHAFGGGGEELGTVAFAPGRAVLDPPARQGLDRVAKALAERPALKLTVVGAADLATERDGMRREQLQTLVRAEKRRTLVAQDKGAADRAAEGAAADLAVTDAEYPALLKAVYRRADMPKPRNLIGLARELPVADMEALLLAQLKPTEADVHALALQRAVAVRDYLIAQQLPAERLFLGAVKTSAGADGAPPEGTGAAAPRPWTPHAELSLTMR